MLVIKVEVWPFGREHRAKEIARMHIANITPDEDEVVHGDYSVAIGEMVPMCSCSEIGFKPRSTGRVDAHPRKLPVWSLVAKALRSVGFSA